MTRAAVLRAEEKAFSVEDITLPPVGPDDVRISVAARGLCGTDLRTLDDPDTRTGRPIVLGHEVAGVVTEVGGGVERARVGDTVVTAFGSTCGHCWFCLRYETHLCANYQLTRAERHVVLADGQHAVVAAGIGGFAEEIVVHQYAVVPVPPELPAEQLALIGCSVATGVGAVTRTAHVRVGASVAVFGCGGVGHFVVQGAQLAGAATIVAVDPVSTKRTAARQAGATDVIDPGTDGVVERILERTGGRGVDYAFEVAGRVETLTQAYAATRRGGMIVAVGLPPAGTSITLDAATLFRDAKRIVGCYYGNVRVREDFPNLVALAVAGRLDLGAAVTRRYPLDQINDAVAALRRGEVIRATIC